MQTAGRLKKINVR